MLPDMFQLTHAMKESVWYYCFKADISMSDNIWKNSDILVGKRTESHILYNYLINKQV